MTRARVLQIGNLAFWVLVAVASIRYILPKWREFDLSQRLSNLEPAWLAGAVVILALQYLLIYAIWRWLILLLGSPAPPGPLFRAFGLSLLPKYIPGKVFGPGLRTRLAAAAGLDYPTVVGSLFWEAGFGLLSATAITALGLALGASHGFEPAARWIVLVPPAVGLVGLVIAQLPLARDLVARWLHPVVARRQVSALAVVFLCYVGAWFLSTAAHWMLARAIGPFPLAHWFPLLLALSASWVIGMLSVFAPAGLGVREGALFIFVAGLMGAPEAVLFVTLSRLIIFAVEIAFTIAAFAFPARRPSLP